MYIAKWKSIVCDTLYTDTVVFYEMLQIDVILEKYSRMS